MSEKRAWALALGIIIALTLLRLAALFLSPLELYPDEAQYWWWAIHPALGYFSKPPLIAWLIGGSLSVCGDSEACIRLTSPLLHAATAMVLFGVGKLLYDSRTALLSALIYVLLPGVAYSATLMSTDVPLLFCWAVALLAFFHLFKDAQARNWRWALLCGAAIGLGLLAKYAMAYFILSMVLGALWVPDVRRVLLTWRGALILIAAAVVFSPNLFWNLTNSFATAGHLAKNAHWVDASFSAENLIDYLVGQFGVFGPVTLALYFWALARVVSGRDHSAEARLLACFSLPPLLMIAVQAFIAEANANWAATAYVAAVPLVARLLITLSRRGASGLALLPNALAAAAILLFTVSPAAVDAAGLANAYKRLHGWRTLGDRVAGEASSGRYKAIVADNRNVVASLLYYARPRNVPVLIWDRDRVDDNHFDMTLRLTPEAGAPLLLVLQRTDPSVVLNTFVSSRLVANVDVGLGGDRMRHTALYAVDKYVGPPERNAGLQDNPRANHASP